MEEPRIELRSTRFRRLPLDYSALVGQALFDVRFVRSPGEYLERSLLVDESNRAEFLDSISGFKSLLEQYERRLSKSRPERSVRPFHKELEHCIRAAILGLGKARINDVEGAVGWWVRANGHLSTAALNLQDASAEYPELQTCLDSLFGPAMEFISAETWPPRLAA